MFPSAFDRRADAQNVEKAVSADLVPKIASAVMSHGSGAAFPFRGGEARCLKDERGTIVQFVTKGGGLQWELSVANYGSHGAVSVTGTDPKQVPGDAISLARDISRALSDAKQFGRLTSPKPEEIPAVPARFSSALQVPIGTAGAALEVDLAWHQLNAALEKNGGKPIGFRISDMSRISTHGEHEFIGITRCPNGDIMVDKSLPQRSNAFIGPRVIVSQNPGVPARFFANADDEVTVHALGAGAIEVANRWISEIKARAY